MKFCLGASLNFGHLPSPAPYTSLIFQANFDRLSFNIPVCMKQETIECCDFDMKCCKSMLFSYMLPLIFFGKPRPVSYFFSKICLPSHIGRLL